MARAPWQVRRRIVVVTLIWCIVLISYLAIWGKADTLREAIATSLVLLMGSVIGTYVFGASWDDKNQRQADLAEKAVQQSAPTETQVRIEQ